MNTDLERHKKLIENIQRNVGEDNYAAILKTLRELRKFEPDDNNCYLLDLTIQKYEALLEVDEIRKDKDTEAILTGLTLTDDSSKNSTRDKNEKEIFEERGERTYIIKNSLKNRVLHAALLICTANNISFDNLTAKHYRNIAKICDSDEKTVRTNISRIKNDKAQGLTVDEKRYYVNWLANQGYYENVVESFPFLNLKSKISA